MRIAALQYANGQVKQCDGSIEASHCLPVNLEQSPCLLNLSSNMGAFVKMHSWII